MLRHIQSVVKNDEEFMKLLHNVMIVVGGVIPNIHNLLCLTESLIAPQRGLLLLRRGIRLMILHQVVICVS